MNYKRSVTQENSEHGHKNIPRITNNAYNHSRNVLSVIPRLVWTDDERLCGCAYRLDSRRTYSVPTIQAYLQLV